LCFPILLAIELVATSGPAFSGDLKILLPNRGAATPAQKLNRDGVAELKRRHLEKAKQLFYRAYLLDPEDPFTLNNLGYVAELEGDADRAQRYYALAGKDHTDAVIDQASAPEFRGRTLDTVLLQVQGSDRELDRVNEQAIVMLQQGRVFEAKSLLQSALAHHSQDPFLLNNLGFTMESIGDLDGALRYYSSAAGVHSNKPIVVTPRSNWRGKPISKIAEGNAEAINEQIARGESAEAATARLNLRGVAALNDNHPSEARQFFLQAYQRDSSNSFTLNNLGYVTELQGDWESAQEYYEAARSGRDANDRVSYSTRPDAEGKRMIQLAGSNQSEVQTTLQTMQAARRRGQQPIELIHRDGGTGNTEPPTKPVPPVGIQPPPMPPLPPPTYEHN
jgi:Flp pilus assembly protein TadD